MQFEEAYPNKPPGVKFISQMFHPNVYATGDLCLDILQNRWSPTYDVAAILTSIQRYGKTLCWECQSDEMQPAQRPQHIFSSQRRSLQPLQGKSARIYETCA